MADTAAPSQAARLESLPRTAQGWIPITLFDKAYFHEGQDFLVQLSHPADGTNAITCAAQWSIDDKRGPLKFVGDWRYVDELRTCEPVAFQPIPDPSPWGDIYAIYWPGVDMAAPGTDATVRSVVGDGGVLLAWESDVKAGVEERRIA